VGGGRRDGQGHQAGYERNHGEQSGQDSMTHMNLPTLVAAAAPWHAPRFDSGVPAERLRETIGDVKRERCHRRATTMARISVAMPESRLARQIGRRAPGIYRPARPWVPVNA
jgi:hypothetical protein